GGGSPMHSTTSKLATLLGTVSVLTVASILSANAQQQVAQGQMTEATQGEAPEQVLVTGYLIHGTVAVGIPVTTLSDKDYVEVGALTTGDLFKDVPSVVILQSVNVTNPGGNAGGGQRFAIHGIGGGGS